MENTGSNNKIFREKSMEQLSTPEQLTGYLRVTGPGVWAVLAGLIILLAGLLVWGTFGRLISTVTVPAKVEGGVVYCFVLQDDLRQFDKNAGKKNADGQNASNQNAGGQNTSNQNADNQYVNNQNADGQNTSNQNTDGQNANTQYVDGQNVNAQNADSQNAGKKDADKKEVDKIQINIGDVHMEADPRAAVSITLDSSSEPELYSSGYLSAGKNVIVLTCITTLKDGFYDAEVVTDELKPISLLFSDK